jgi:[ribosomal protein S18]-alanine N-acetyltransferase
MGAPVIVSLAKDNGTDPHAIMAIDGACFADGTVNIAAELERPWSQVWVAREENESSEPRAFLLAWLVVDELHVLSVATLPGFRRKGMARALLLRSIDFARERKVRILLLEVRRSNSAAIRLYRSLGFSAVTLRAEYYADNSEDAVEMSLELDPTTGAILPGQDAVSI